MKGMKYIPVVFLLACSVILAACGTEKGPEKPENSVGNRTELTEEEIKGGHASFQMAENLVVDADVTAKEKYEKGLSSYYLKIVCETDKASEKKFLKAPTVSLHSFGEWQEMLNKIVPGKFPDNQFKLNKSDANIRQEYEGENGSSYSFHAEWSDYKRGVAEKTGFNSPGITVEKGKVSALSNRAVNVRTHVQNYRGSGEIEFLEEAEENVEKMKEFLQEMTGRSVYGGYDYVVVDKETIALLNKSQPWMEAEEPKENYAVFYFYYDINGLPFKNLSLDYMVENDVTVDELCYWSSMPGKMLKAISEHAQELVISRDGIVGLDCSNLRYPGEVYQEKMPVTSPNEALKQVGEFYDRQLRTEQCVVTDIELLYTGYFSDGADGKIQPVIAPFWEIKVYDNSAGRYTHFTYDAFTGECIREGVQQ